MSDQMMQQIISEALAGQLGDPCYWKQRVGNDTAFVHVQRDEGASDLTDEALKQFCDTLKLKGLRIIDQARERQSGQTVTVVIVGCDERVAIDVLKKWEKALKDRAAG